MKKLICWLLTLAICLGLAACGTPAPVETSAPPTTVPGTAAPAETDPAPTVPPTTEPAETVPVETEPAVTEPALATPGDIIAAAYALADGESMDEAVTLTGTVSSVDTAWSEQYQNITVTIKVAGYEDKPIMCYRLAGEGAKDLAYGDVITVTGTIKNYSGIIEFAQGCGLDSVVKGTGEGPESPVDYDVIVEEAKALKPGQSLPYVATLTGRVESIDYAYSAKYNDMSITIEVRGQDIYCYRLTSPRTDWLKQVGEKDWVTVMGKIKNYNGTIEFDGATMIAYTDFYKVEGPEDPLEHIDAAYELKEGKSLEYESTLTGVVTSVDTPWSDTYKNITVTIQVPGREDKPIQCYRLSGEGAEGLAVGDTITVTGTLKNYMGKVEFDQGCEVIDIVKGEAPVVPEEPEEPEEPTTTLEYVTSVTAGTAYKLGLDQTKKESVYFFTGVMSGYYGATENNYNKAIDVYLEETTGGFYLYFTDANGAKQYINLVKSGTHYNFTFGDAAASVFEFDEEKDALCTDVEGEVCYMGTYGNYVTVGVLQTSKLTDTDYIARLYVGGGSTETPDEPTTPSEPTTPDEPENNDPAADSTLTIPEAVALGETKEKDEYTAGKYYVSGTVKEVTNTTFGNMVIEDAEGNTLTVYGTYSADGATRYDAMETKPVAGDTVKVYGVIGKYYAAQMKNGWIVEHTPAETIPEETTPEETTPEETTPETTAPEETTPEDPAADSTLTIPEAIALGETKEKDEYTAGKYYVTGEITEVYNTQYGNMKIKDADGNILTVYGTYSADGSTRYDAMETKPVAGDTVKVYGVIGKYNAVQMKDGWIVEHTPAETTPGGDDDTTPDPTATLMTSAPKNGDVILLGNGSYIMTDTLDYNKLVGTEVTITDGAVTLADGMAKLTVTIDSNGYYIFSSGSKYLSTNITGNSLTLESELNNSARWTIEKTGDNWYIINARALKSGAKQYVEFYNGKFTTYGLGGGGSAYELQLYYVEAGTPVTIPTFAKPETAADIVAAAYDLIPGTTLAEGPYTLEGVVSAIEGTNVTVTVEDKSILCYNLASGAASVDGLGVGDTITVQGDLENVDGTVRFADGCTLEALEKVQLDELPASLTYNFSGVTQQGTEIKDAAAALGIFLAAEDNNNLQSVVFTKIYAGNSGGGAYGKTAGLLKTGTSSVAGQIVLTYADDVKVSKVEIKCHDWNTLSDSYPTNSNNIAVNGSATQLVPYTTDATAGVLTFELDGTSNVVTIDANKRVFIFEIVVYFAQ